MKTLNKEDDITKKWNEMERKRKELSKEEKRINTNNCKLRGESL